MSNGHTVNFLQLQQQKNFKCWILHRFHHYKNYIGNVSHLLSCQWRSRFSSVYLIEYVELYFCSIQTGSHNINSHETVSSVYFCKQYFEEHIYLLERNSRSINACTNVTQTENFCYVQQWPLTVLLFPNHIIL